MNEDNLDVLVTLCLINEVRHEELRLSVAGVSLGWIVELDLEEPWHSGAVAEAVLDCISFRYVFLSVRHY